jgi:hypothetical protein
MPRRAAFTSLVLAVALVGVAASLGAAQSEGGDVVADPGVLAQPTATAGETATPASNATAIPFETSMPPPAGSPTATATPAAEHQYFTPGYGNAAQQDQDVKRTERDKTCNNPRRPPTSHMLGVPGVVVGGGTGGNLALIIIAVAIGAALVAFFAYRLRRGDKTSTPSSLEGIATLVAICGGLAGLAAQFIPEASVEERPPRQATMVVRDVKPRITRQEYLHRMHASVRSLDEFDRAEIGNVVWLQITLTGFKDRAARVEYGLYDLDAREALLPGTSRPLELTPARHDEQTVFVPIWVGFPRSDHFKAEFRLVDRDGVQQMVATGPMRGTLFRYACSSKA